VVYRLWSSGVHRRPFELRDPAKELGRRPARAIVRPTTDLAPASRNARTHASSVAPVVITSSSSRIRKLSTRPPSRIAKAPRTGSHRPRFADRASLFVFQQTNGPRKPAIVESKAAGNLKSESVLLPVWAARDCIRKFRFKHTGRSATIGAPWRNFLKTGQVVVANRQPASAEQNLFAEPTWRRKQTLPIVPDRSLHHHQLRLKSQAWRRHHPDR
jgi:hypothetical protein